jgi:diguanylate cyclase (GGDEF)-like protein
VGTDGPAGRPASGRAARPAEPPPAARLVTWTSAFFSHPNQVAALFWAGGAVASASALILVRWPASSRLALLAVTGVCGAGAAVRILLGARPRRWALHLDLATAVLAVSILAAVGAAGHVAFQDLYIWIGVFATLYLPFRGALVQTGAAGAAYAAVLAVGPPVAQPVAAWLAVFGTLGVAGTVTFMLVSYLRGTSLTDPLTGLANRRSFDQRLEEEMRRALRTGAPCSLVVADLDGFKAINDRAGHAAGDRVLQDLSKAWRSEVREGGDFLARLGGDEFVVLGPGSGAVGGRRLAKRLEATLPAGLAASFGVASWDGSEAGQDLLRRADEAMYRAKAARRAQLTRSRGA